MSTRPLRTPRERVGSLPNVALPPPDGGSEMLHRALIDGDPAAFREAVRSLEPSMLRTAMAVVRSADDAHDVVQETWLAALTAIDRFEGRAALRTWLFRILTYRARSWARKRRRSVPLSHLGFEGGDLPGLPLHQKAPTRPDVAFDIKEGLHRVARAIRVLPARQRAVMTQRAVRGASPDEVSKALGVSRSNQRVLLHRARSRLRRQLAA